MPRDDDRRCGGCRRRQPKIDGSCGAVVTPARTARTTNIYCLSSIRCSLALGVDLQVFQVSKFACPSTIITSTTSTWRTYFGCIKWNSYPRESMKDCVTCSIRPPPSTIEDTEDRVWFNSSQCFNIRSSISIKSDLIVIVVGSHNY